MSKPPHLDENALRSRCEGKENKPGHKELPKGDILKGGTAAAFETGDWRTCRPIKDEKLCINCLFCYINCPDSAIPVIDGKMGEIDLRYCKGCGICVNVCPVKPIKALKMVPER